MDHNAIAVVVIGRNEGQRLHACLHALLAVVKQVVYVDSGSSDDSVAFAKSLAVDVVELDMTVPFTAARARNSGAWRAVEKWPHCDYIQFVDGDCTIDRQWLQQGYHFLQQHHHYAVVFGRRRERYPNRTRFNRLCDIEWQKPAGDVGTCGGDAMIRRVAFVKTKGYNAQLIAGEEPELCFRLTQQGWKIRCLDAAMTQHDAAITHYGQWWQRAKRAGYAYANNAYLHRQYLSLHQYRPLASCLFWTIGLPSLLTIFSDLYPAILILLFLYLLQMIRISVSIFPAVQQWSHAGSYGVHTLLAKWPQTWGMIVFCITLLLKRQGQLIEYK